MPIGVIQGVLEEVVPPEIDPYDQEEREAIESENEGDKRWSSKQQQIPQ